MQLKNALCSIGVLLCSLAEATPPRIGATTIDKREVQKLYIAYGRSSILIFPCNIKSFSTGPTKDISALLNERDSKILEIWLSKSGSQPAGLKVICNDNLFAFDVIPSTTTHQDFITVKGSYGSPVTYSGVESQLKGTVVATSEASAKQVTTRLPKVIRVISSSKDAQEAPQ